MSTEFKIMLAIGLFTLGLFVGGVWWVSQAQNPANNLVPDNKLIAANSPTLGANTASVLLVEFGDYQCPSCAATHPTIKALLAAYPTQLKFIFRHFPLNQHPHAPLAAEAAEAAGTQGKYWEMHSWLYEHQTEWSSSQNPGPLFSAAAQSLGLDVAKFDQAIKDKVGLANVQQGLADGNSIGVNATPTFYLNGRRFQGSADQLKAEVDKLVSQAK